MSRSLLGISVEAAQHEEERKVLAARETFIRAVENRVMGQLFRQALRVEAGRFWDSYAQSEFDRLIAKLAEQHQLIHNMAALSHVPD